LDVVGGFSIVNEVFLVRIKFELAWISLIIQTDAFTFVQDSEVTLALLLLLTHLLAVGLLALLEIFDGLVRIGLVIPLLAFILDRVHFFLNLSVLLLKLSCKLLTSSLQTFNVLQCLLIWHQRLKRYKFLELQILDVVLSELVNVEGVQVLEEDILRKDHLLDGLTLSILLLRRLGLISEAHLHEGHLSECGAG